MPWFWLWVQEKPRSESRRIYTKYSTTKNYFKKSTKRTAYRSPLGISISIGSAHIQIPAVHLFGPALYVKPSTISSSFIHSSNSKSCFKKIFLKLLSKRNIYLHFSVYIAIYTNNQEKNLIRNFFLFCEFQ